VSKGSTHLRAGFTLLETLLVLGLISMLAAVLIGGSASLLKGTSREDPEDALLALLQTVRREAVAQGTTLILKTVADEEDPDVTHYTWGENKMERMPILAGVKVKIVGPAVNAAIILGGEMEELALTQIKFYPDGTCDRFRLEISRNAARRVLPIDPLTCAPLPAEKTK
jgi:prepilin-type N-terminal cleavage/methylation domain-containing protein